MQMWADAAASHFKNRRRNDAATNLEKNPRDASGLRRWRRGVGACT